MLRRWMSMRTVALPLMLRLRSPKLANDIYKKLASWMHGVSDAFATVPCILINLDWGPRISPPMVVSVFVHFICSTFRILCASRLCSLHCPPAAARLPTEDHFRPSNRDRKPIDYTILRLTITTEMLFKTVCILTCSSTTMHCVDSDATLLTLDHPFYQERKIPGVIKKLLRRCYSKESREALIA